MKKKTTIKETRLVANLLKAKDPLSYLTISKHLCFQFTGLDKEYVKNELAKIGTDYAAELWDKPESNGLQVQESIQKISKQAKKFMDELSHLGPLARLIVYGAWLPDPEDLSDSSIDEPLKIKERHLRTFLSSPEFHWLIRLQMLGEEWKPLWESYRESGEFAKRPIDEPSLQLKEQCEWFLAELGRRGKRQKYQYAVSVRGLAGKIFEVVTGKEPTKGQFR